MVNPFVNANRRKEESTVTPSDIIYHRRLHVIERAAIVGVSQACRENGVSRTCYYRWVNTASRYGLSALVPKPRRRPAMPNQISGYEEERILAEALAQPGCGARRLLESLSQAGVHRSASGVQAVLRRHHLATRRQRAAALAALTAADTGLVASRATEPFGFCLWAAQPGDLVGVDAFYVGKLKGVGPVYQLTAVDTRTRWAICRLLVGRVTAKAAAAFVKHLARAFRRLGVIVRAVLTDNGPEFIGQDFTKSLAALKLAHHRIPPRSPNHNAVCERFHGTLLHECWRPAFHRRRYDRLADLDALLQDWLHRYNTRRRNHSRYMKGRTPKEVLAAK